MIGSRSWPRLAATKTESTRVSQRPRLSFTPYAWAKLVFLRNLGPTEIGGFGICDPADLLLDGHAPMLDFGHDAVIGKTVMPVADNQVIEEPDMHQ